MPEKIQTITLALPLGLGSVNCYLIQNENGYFLIDTGASNRGTQVHQALAQAGCRRGDLKLILLTHGDFDHTGNVAALHSQYDAPVALHRDDLSMAEQGNMFSGRQTGNPVMNWVSARLFGFGKANRFSPDLFLDEDSDLSAYGLNVRVLSIPGHSRGSVAFLTAEGNLFSGDLLENLKEPVIGSIIDDLPAAQASIARLQGLGAVTVYPGHGQPFSLADYTPTESK